MTLSIVTPVYNVAPYLPATIESILNQTFKDFELILIDDGSTDGSDKICLHYANLDNRVRVIRQTNQGVSAARNRGIEASAGELVGFVDSDDLICKDMYARMTHIIRHSNADIVQCNHDRADVSDVHHSNRKESSYICISGPEFVSRLFAMRGSEYTNQVSLCTKIFKKTILEKIRFPEGQTYEDEHETYKACYFAKKIAITDDIFYHYIKRENSIITGIAPRKMRDKQMALYDRSQWLPAYMPELTQKAFLSFISYSKHILCELWKNDNLMDFNCALQLMLKAVKNNKAYLNAYDRFYIRLLKHDFCKTWIMKNDFSPVQNLISKLK